MTALIIAGVILIGMVVIGITMATLYKRASKEMSFVRTGMGGEKVIMDGGAVVFPVFHEVIMVNMQTLRLTVDRNQGDALITKDRMRADVKAEFYVRVAKSTEAVAMAAQTLGHRTIKIEALRELIEGKFVDALRAVAAGMDMEQLHENRPEFVQKVQEAVAEDIKQNGLELESVSLTALDQTDKKFFNPDNAFDAAGLTKLTETIESRRKQRNDIERDTKVQIETKNLQTEKQSLTIARDQEYAALEQTREVETRRASQAATIAREQAEQQKLAEEARIEAQRAVDLENIKAQKEVEAEQIKKAQAIEEAEISRKQAVETADVARDREVQIAAQNKNIAVAKKREEEMAAQALAEEAKALTAAAEEKVITAKETEAAEREKAVEIIEAQRLAESAAVGIKVAAEAEKAAAIDKAAAIKTLAQAEADQITIKAEADEKKYAVDAEGTQALHEAENKLSKEIISMRIKLAVVEHAHEIINASTEPVKAIDSIKIIQVDGLQAGGNGGSSGGGSTNLAESATNAALNYRMQRPFVDSILKEIGMSGTDSKVVTDTLSRLTGLVPEAAGVVEEVEGEVPPSKTSSPSQPVAAE